MSEQIDAQVTQRKQRWRRFYDRSEAPRHIVLIQHSEGAPEVPRPHPDKKQERIECAWKSYQRHLDQMQWLDDDSIPCLHVHTGTEIFAEAFGCAVHRTDDDMPFALPMIHSASEVAELQVPDFGATPLAMLFEMADELRSRAGNGAVLKMVDIQSPMDISALIWDKNDLYVAMLDAPEAVKELSHKVEQLLTAFLDEWFSRYGEEFVAHYPSYYMPRGITLSEDEVGAVNEEMFVEFFLPELAELSERYGGIGVHCCAHAQHQWDNFKKIPGLRLLNLVQPPEVLQAAYAFFADHVPQMHSWCGSGDPLSWPGQYPEGARVVIQAAAETKEQAIALCEGLRRACAAS